MAGTKRLDAVRAGLIPSDQATPLKEKAEEAEDLRLKIESALAARDPRGADKLTYELEDCLDELEDIAAKF